MEVIDPRVVNFSFSHFTNMLTLEDLDPLIFQQFFA